MRGYPASKKESAQNILELSDIEIGLLANCLAKTMHIDCSVTDIVHIEHDGIGGL